MSQESRLRRLNDSLLAGGNDYSDVLLDAAEELAQLRRAVAAWQSRFPQYAYRPQDDCIELNVAFFEKGLRQS